MKEWLPIIQLHLHKKILLLVMLFALHSIFWRQSFHFTSVSHQTLISKGHFQRDSYPFIISFCFHIMPDLFTNTNILPPSEITTNTSFPVTQEFISLTPPRILNSLGETENLPFIQLPGYQVMLTSGE